jgi:hypothetical protein
LLIPAGGTMAATASESFRSLEPTKDVTAVTLDVSLSTTDTLPVAVRRSLIREVEAIWSREGVTVRWSNPGGGDTSPDGSIQVAVTSWPLGGTAESQLAWPIGELLTTEAGHSIVRVSVAGARRVIQASGGAQAEETFANHRLGVILGRAVAHELGHHLLGHGHARRGLMRACISPIEFADLRVGGFGLDSSSVARMRARLATAAFHPRPAQIPNR